eukprot:GHVN01094655.1.p1 GENE.GHVN01094655.1~~GHVN01094655.1.p1  ORF type:complete len:795 (+),score=118.35 GHVN01094655.1:100-2484(+)
MSDYDPTREGGHECFSTSEHHDSSAEGAHGSSPQIPDDSSLISIPAMIANLRSDTVAARFEAITHLGSIAGALGPKRTREELLPFVLDLCSTTPPSEAADELNEELAIQMCYSLSWVGGPKHCTAVLPLLFQLASESDTAVRDNAIAAMHKVVCESAVSASIIVSGLGPAINTLSTAESSALQGAACGVIPALMKGINSLLANTTRWQPSTSTSRASLASDQADTTTAGDGSARSAESPSAEGTAGRGKAKQPSAKQRQKDLQLLPCVIQLHSQLLSRYVDLCQADRSPFAVRRSGNKYLPDLIEAICWPHQSPDPETGEALGAMTQEESDRRANGLDTALKLIQDFASEAETESVKILTAISVASLLQHQPSMFEPHLLSIITCLAGDRLWRVRFMVTDQMIPLINGLRDVTMSGGHLFPLIPSLLEDVVPEVRSATLERLPQVLEVLGDGGRSAEANVVKDGEGNGGASGVNRSAAGGGRHGRAELLSVLEPQLDLLGRDVDKNVRLCLGEALVKVCRLYANDRETVVAILVPLVLRLLRDEEPLVRLGAVTAVPELTSCVDMANFKEFLEPAINETAHDSNWRVRETLLGYLPRLAQHMDTKAITEFGVCQLYMQGLSDPVWSIRTATAGAIHQLVQVVGVEWIEAVILPHLEELRTHKHYIFRGNVMTCIASLSRFLPKSEGESPSPSHQAIKVVDGAQQAIKEPKALLHRLFKLAFELAGDPVANIRITVARALMSVKMANEEIIGQDGELEDDIADCLKMLSNDDDEDVRFFAQQAMGADHQPQITMT